jgi:hypothetical protein
MRFLAEPGYIPATYAPVERKPLMRLFCWALAVAGSLLWTSVSSAQEDELGLCRAIEDDSRRLECYDEIPLRPGLLRRKYEAVPLEELRTYRLSYRGRFVEVEGWVAPSGEYLSLGAAPDDSSTMPVELETLPRRDREALLEQCASGCSAVVRGRVSPVNFTTGIIADTVVAR